MAKDIVDIAIGEIGYSEEGNNRTKYGAWYGMNGAPWCHMFVSWCANQAGVSTSVIPKTASATDGMNWFKKKGLFKYKEKYTPKRGDIIYFKSAGASHVGIVEKVSGDTVYTVEGNTCSKVGRRNYPLNVVIITGYGTPQYASMNQSTNSAGSETAKKTSEKELQYLKKILKKRESTAADVKGSVLATNKLPDGEVVVMIKNGKKFFEVPAEDGLKVVWERRGMPGKLTFASKYDKKFKIVEGDSVTISVDGKNLFYGFIFTRQMSKDGMVSYTAYDQLRYLKNKDTMIYKKKTADWVVKAIAEKFNLRCGALADTCYKIPKTIEDDITLLDIIQNALDETLMAKGRVYVLYDEVGKLRLTDVSSMKVDSCLVDEETGEDFTYKTTIDSDVYNQIKLIYENEEKGTYDLYVTKDSKKINKWGVLQYTDKIDDPDIGKLKANALLQLYNKKQRTLDVSGVVGNKKVRAGSLIPVILDLGDIKVANYMMVEKVTHIFKNHQYTMDLVLSGGDFSA